MKISIIVVNANMRHFLEPLLTSIKDNVKKVAHEVIVVDNNSTDDSRKMIRERFPNVLLIEMDHNAGFGKASNCGAQAAKGKYLLLLNPDTIVCGDAVQSMFKFLEREKSAAVVGCKLLNPDGTLQRSCGIFPNLRTEFFVRTFLNRIFPKGKMAGSYLLGAWDYSTTAEVDWVSGACLMIRKSVFDSLGGFDEQLFMYYEDVELCYRTNQLGWKVYFFPQAAIYHYLGGSWQTNRAIPIINGCRSSLYFFRKHRQSWETNVLKVFMLLEILLFYTLFVPLSILKGESRLIVKTRLHGYNSTLKFIFKDPLTVNG